MGVPISELLQEATEFALSGKNDNAVEIFEKVVSIDPENANAWYCLGVLLSESGNFTEAIHSFENSDKFYPNHGPTLVNLAILLEDENPDKASELAKSALIFYPDDERLKEIYSNKEPANNTDKLFVNSIPLPDDEFDLNGSHTERNPSQNDKISDAQDLTSRGEHSSAVSIWKSLLEDSPNSSEVWRGLGEALLSAGFPDRAEQCRIKADILSDKENEYIKHDNIDEIDSTEALIQAAQDYETIDHDIPERGDLEESLGWYNMGINLMSEGKNDEAISSFEKAIGGSPAEEHDFKVKAHNGRGNALYNSGRFPESIVAYHTAISIDPNSVSGRTLFNMGSSYAAVEMFDDAVKCFSQALERGLDKDEVELCEKHISRCRMLSREQAKRQSRISR